MNIPPAAIPGRVLHLAQHFKLLSMLMKILVMRKINDINILRTFFSVTCLMTAAFFPTALFAQHNQDTVKSNLTSNGGDIGQQMFDYSRPGKYHQIFADLVGSWTFKGRRFPLNPDPSKAKFDLFGTHVWKPFAEGRCFTVDMTFGDSLHKMRIPIQNGKTKEVIGQGIAIEGYDNVKKKFVQVYITNHIGSDISFWEGSYDLTTRTITFDCKEELVPGLKDEIRELLIIVDKDHYTLEYYHKENKDYVKDTEVICTRIKGE